MIGHVYIDLYNQDSIKKNLLVTYDNGQITNNELYSESFSLKESLCSESELRFGCCEASELTIKIANIESSLKGKWLTIQETLADESELFTFGKYKVYSDTPSSDRNYRNIVAYDLMYDIINANVAEWYNSLTFPMTQKEFRDSFFSYFGITQVSVALIHDEIELEKTIDANVISGKDVITSICELNGVFGHINRDNCFEYISLDNSTAITIDKSLVKSGEYDDFITTTISKIQIRQEENDIGSIYGDGENCYVIENNFLVYGKSSEELNNICATLYNKINGIAYRPFKAEIKGNPCHMVGDAITIETRNKVINSFILERVISGIQNLIDKLESKGVVEYSEDVNSLNKDIVQLKGKTNVLERSIEETKSIIEDIEQGLSAEIKQTADNITAEVKATYTTNEEFDNLKVGGRNLIRNSNFVDGTAYWQCVGVTKEVIEDDSFGQCLSFSGAEAGSTNYRIYPYTSVFSHENGEVYALSFWAKADSAATLRSSIGGTSYCAKDYSVTTSWQKFTYIYTATYAASLTFWINEANITVYLANVKIEKGNKATDWTPAPEDIDADITEVKTNLANNYYTKTETEAKFTVSKDSIISEVSATYTTQETFNNLEIGVRNLILNSSIREHVRTSDYLSYTYIDMTWILSEYGVNLLRNGGEFTLSYDYEITGITTACEIKPCINITSGSYANIGNFVSIPTGDSSGHVSHTFTPTVAQAENGTKMMILGLVKDTNEGASFIFKNIKLEKGIKETNWTPAPEDVDENIEGVKTNLSENYYTKIETESRIELSANSITSTVKETYATKTEMSTVAQTASDLTVKLEQTNKNVSTAQDTADAAQKNLDELQIGSRNLLLSTEQVKVLSDGNVRYELSDYGEVVLANGATVTISFEAKADVATGIDTYPRYGTDNTSLTAKRKTFSITTEWAKYSAVVSLDALDYTQWSIRSNNNVTGGSSDAVVNIRKVKLELGNKATDWTKAPEEMEESIGNAAKTATNYLNFSSAGLCIGDMTAEVLGRNILVSSEQINIRNVTEVLASFSESEIHLSSATDNAKIYFCETGYIHGEYNDERDYMKMTVVTDGFGVKAKKEISLSANSDEDSEGNHAGISITGYTENLDGEKDGYLNIYSYDQIDGILYKSSIEFGYAIEKDVKHLLLTVSAGTEEAFLKLYPARFEIATETYFGYDIHIPQTASIYSGEQECEILRLGGDIETPICIVGDGIRSGGAGYTNICGAASVNLLTTDERIVLQNINNGTYSAFFRPNTTGLCTLGSSSYKWYAVYAKNGTIQTSDRREKENIIPMNENVITTFSTDGENATIDIYSELFDRLKPVQYNFIEGNGKVCYGLIAQDVIEVLNELGMDENELELVHHDIFNDEETGEETETFGISYTNLIALLIHEVQKLKEKIA